MLSVIGLMIASAVLLTKWDESAVESRMRAVIEAPQSITAGQSFKLQYRIHFDSDSPATNVSLRLTAPGMEPGELTRSIGELIRNRFAYDAFSLAAPAGAQPGGYPLQVELEFMAASRLKLPGPWIADGVRHYRIVRRAEVIVSRRAASGR